MELIRVVLGMAVSASTTAVICYLIGFNPETIAVGVILAPLFFIAIRYGSTG